MRGVLSSTIDRYLLAEKAGSEGVWDWDLRNDTMFLSPRFKDFLGLPPGDSNRPEDWLDRVHPEDIDWLYASFEGQMVGVSVPFQIEHRVLRAESDPAGEDGATNGGRWRWLVCRGMAVMDESGDPARLVGSVADITDRKNAERDLRRSEERYALAAAASNDGLFDWDLAAGTVYYSPRWTALLGFADKTIGNSPEEWLGRVLPDDRAALRAALDALGIDNTLFQIEYRMRDAANGVRWMSCRGIAVLGADGTPVRLVGSQADVTDRKTAEQRLRQSEERYALAAAGANDGLWDWRIDTGEVYYSPRCAALLGLDAASPADAKPANTTAPDSPAPDTTSAWFNRVLPDDREGLKSAIDLHLAGERDHVEHEFRIHAADGGTPWLLVRGLAVREAGRAVRIAGSMTDITARKKAEQQVLFDAFHDSMTGLPNRTLLLDRVGQALDRNRRAGGKPFAVLLIDLDRFKSINDALGPAAGDTLLKIIADRLDSIRRMGDTLARLSVDEFAMLLDDVADVGSALAAAERMAATIGRPLALDGHELALTASIGIALSATGYDRAEDMLRDAGLAMYRAKSGGRARIDVFDSNLRRQAMTRIRTETDLRTALEQNQLCLFYQPIIGVSAGRIAGFEALMRWRHPERGLVPPGEFIPLAEESGLIVPMGRWALREATRQLSLWQRQFPRRTPLFMSVNVSSRQFRDDDLVGLVQEVLDEYRVPPATLKLEITESLLMQDPAKCRELMQMIRDMDVRLSIDDFGTGYSSLSYLHKFPADTLKIDRSFVQAVSSGEGNAAIVQVITTLATILGMDAVAEGVETEAEAEFLRDIMCKYAQGYLYARPAPPEDIERLLVKELTEPLVDGIF